VVSAPEIVSVDVTGAGNDRLVVVASEPVNVANTTGLSIVTDGDPRTITSGFRPGGGVAGSGTDTFHLSLDGAIAAEDSWELDYDATNTISALDGTRLLAGSTVGNGGGPPAPAAGPIVEVTHASSTTTIAVGQNIRVYVSGGAPPTIYTPPTPANGDRFTITDADGLFATTPCVLTASPGQAIEDPATPGSYSDVAGDMSLEGTSESVAYEFIALLSRWKVV
jgi:hypothetical protein